MTRTSHGHLIPGTIHDESLKVNIDNVLYLNKARCGGILLCAVCRKDAAAFHHPAKKETVTNMTVQTEKYARKPFFIDAVQVTEENMAEIAKWCDGTLEKSTKGNSFIRVRVHRPLYDRQTKAFLTDWVLYSGNGYKVYTDKAFQMTFEKNKVESIG